MMMIRKSCAKCNVRRLEVVSSFEQIRHGEPPAKFIASPSTSLGMNFVERLGENSVEPCHALNRLRRSLP